MPAIQQEVAPLTGPEAERIQTRSVKQQPVFSIKLSFAKGELPEAEGI
jgi:hypothetical protein